MIPVFQFGSQTADAPSFLVSQRRTLSLTAGWWSALTGRLLRSCSFHEDTDSEKFAVNGCTRCKEDAAFRDSEKNKNDNQGKVDSLQLYMKPSLPHSHFPSLLLQLLSWCYYLSLVMFICKFWEFLLFLAFQAQDFIRNFPHRHETVCRKTGNFCD